MSDKLFRISTPTIKYTIDDEFDMSRVASSRFIICNMGNKNRIVKENPTIEGMAFRTDLTQEETKKLNAGIISAQIHILLNNHKVIWTDIAKTTMNGVLGEDMFDVPDYSADTGEYEIDFHGTVSDYDVPLHGHLDVTLEGSTVIPNPEGEATDDLTKVEIDGEIFLVKDSTIHDWARAEEKPSYTKAEIGLGNVDNTSDLNKPISTATQTALDGKVDKDGDKVLSDNNYSDTDKSIVGGVTSALADKVDKVEGYGLSKNDYDDTAKGIVDNVTTNLATKVDKVEGKGLSANDFTDTLKDKLDGIEAEANKTIVDNSVTATSTNPVESKAIYNLLNDLLPEATETGNPIAITNASGLNAKSLKVELEPIQDLHGYDKPWAGGGGKNKLKTTGTSQTRAEVSYTVNSDGTVLVNGTANETNPYTVGTLELKGGTSYTISSSANNDNNFYLQVIGEGIASINTVSGAMTFTPNADLTGTVRIVVVNGKNVNNVLIKPMICLASASEPTTFAPYSNICPISGRNSLDITVNGETTTIQFGQTVYGGTCDVVNGGTTSEWQNVNVTSASQIRRNTAKQFYVYGVDGFEAGTSVVSDKFRTAGSGSGVCFINSSGAIRFNTVDEYETAEACYNAIGNIQFVAKSSSSTTINTPTTSISLNKGNNTLSTSGDNMDLKYSKIPQ